MSPVTGDPSVLVASASRERIRLIEAQRRELRQTFIRRFWLRWHMVLMLIATFGAGLLANKLMLLIPVHEMALRWVLALAVSYLAFFGCVRIWLAYVGARPIYGGDGSDVLGSIDPETPGTTSAIFHGGGGQFGGGGASGDWGDSSVGSVGNISSGAADIGDADGCGLIILGIAVLALLAATAGGVVYLLVGAPAMLADTAFSALLAGGLVKHVRRMDELDWEGSVLRSTWKPFVGVVVMALIAGIVAHLVVPGAHTLTEVLMQFH
ncbi:MAG: hypothetical protein ABI607_00030 [Betaproteobacteria bacterium]